MRFLEECQTGLTQSNACGSPLKTLLQACVALYMLGPIFTTILDSALR